MSVPRLFSAPASGSSSCFRRESRGQQRVGKTGEHLGAGGERACLALEEAAGTAAPTVEQRGNLAPERLHVHRELFARRQHEERVLAAGGRQQRELAR